MKRRSNEKPIGATPKTQWKLPAILISGVVISGLIVTIWNVSKPSPGEGAVDVIVPVLSKTAVAGKVAFDTNCAECHGANAMGTEKGPPFIHDIYNPGHHSDKAFFLAVRQGVRRHHWPYGDMPSQPQVSNQELAVIIRYVRELQEANGIAYQRHNM